MMLEANLFVGKIELLRIFLSAICLGALSACTGGASNPTSSGFAVPNAQGTLSAVPNEFRSGSRFLPSGAGFGFQLGDTDGDGYRGFAGIVNEDLIAPPPVSGSAEMTGRFEVGLISGIFVSSDTIRGGHQIDFGTLSVTVDFANQTFVGSGTGVDTLLNLNLNGNSLTVDGTFDGSVMSGTATYDGVSGPMTGAVGATEAIGAFHGHVSNQIHAGGFTVSQ